ncbi:MAG TPA: glutamate--tRNA ligase [Bacilli bacterium]|nr:glutamate--tRNA ligase [Bacilli bacterium]HPZ26800.1 glutamate--tRNA ligase [Bacilli bacterium]
MNKVRTRFAPSPTGYMHLGNLRTALYAYLFAKKHNGDFILRIEDTDMGRYVPDAVKVIYETLAAVGIKADEGPNEGGPCAPYVQSERLGLYREHAEKLVNSGHAYYCFCDKERLEKLRDENGVARYDKRCLSLSKTEVEQKLKSGAPYVIRQNMPTEGVCEFTDLVFGTIAVDNRELEDQILIKSDGYPTYNFANVVDDHLMAITHVIRGTEFLSSTPKYNLLYKAFGWEIPKYIHLSPIMRDENRKLSKRHGDAYFGDFIAKGYLSEAIINYIALLGWSPKGEREKFTLEELTEHFSVEGLQKSGGIFDENKMKWLNGEYVRELAFDKFMEHATPFFEKSKIKGLYDYRKFAVLLQSRIDIFSEIPEKVDFIVDFKEIPKEAYNNKKFKVNPEIAKAIIEKSLSLLEDATPWNEKKLHEAIAAIAAAGEWKTGAVYSVLRLALTAHAVTPGGFVEIADILGREESLRRLGEALKGLK